MLRMFFSAMRFNSPVVIPGSTDRLSSVKVAPTIAPARAMASNSRRDLIVIPPVYDDGELEAVIRLGWSFTIIIIPQPSSPGLSGPDR